jgi:hypothetical protein
MIDKNLNLVEVEDSEYGVDSRYESKINRMADGEALMEARLRRMKNVSGELIVKGKLLQLKFKMEEYLLDTDSDNECKFTDFLSQYIDMLYDKRSHFSEDIDITPVLLSQILNNHRQPSEEFMLRLMVHSENAFLNVCSFQKKSWYQIYYQEKINKMMSNQGEWRSKVAKHVKMINPSNL